MAKWLKTAKCDRCDERFRYVTRMGLCRKRLAKTGREKTFYFVDLWCFGCKTSHTYTLHELMTVREMVAGYVEQFEAEKTRKRRRAERARERRRRVAEQRRKNAPAITAADVQRARQILERSQTHEQFLRSIGLSERQIRRAAARRREQRGDGDGGGGGGDNDTATSA